MLQECLKSSSLIPSVPLPQCCVKEDGLLGDRDRNTGGGAACGGGGGGGKGWRHGASGCFTAGLVGGER